jgi:hypothetical protein
VFGDHISDEEVALRSVVAQEHGLNDDEDNKYPLMLLDAHTPLEVVVFYSQVL